MDIEAQFNLIAEEYDINRRKFIPCFDDYYKNTTAFILSNIAEPKRVLDLGAGTGLFVNYDQFCAGQVKLDGWFDSYWERQLADSGLTERDLELWKERRKLDRECSVEEEMAMLYKSHFSSIKCVYSYQKFSVIVAIK